MPASRFAVPIGAERLEVQRVAQVACLRKSGEASRSHALQLECKGNNMKPLTLLPAVLCAMAMPAFANDACTAATTRGFYGFTCDGYLAPAPSTPLQPARSLGTCTADRSGFFTCEATVNLAGQPLMQTLKGQAVTSADCTGTITYQQTIFGQPVPDLHIRYFVLDEGDTIKGLPLDSGQVLSCVLKRIRN